MLKPLLRRDLPSVRDMHVLSGFRPQSAESIEYLRSRGSICCMCCCCVCCCCCCCCVCCCCVCSFGTLTLLSTLLCVARAEERGVPSLEV